MNYTGPLRRRYKLEFTRVAPSSIRTSLGTWKSATSRITLYKSDNKLVADFSNGKGMICFTEDQIFCGIMGDCSHQRFIEKITEISCENIAVFPYPKKNPTELRVFEANKVTGFQIKLGMTHLKKIESNPEDAFTLYQKVLKCFKKALALQIEAEKDTTDLVKAISHVNEDIVLLECDNAALYLPNEKEVEILSEIFETYEDNEDIFECFEKLLSYEENFSFLHHFLSAIIHEKKGEFLLAAKDYLSLSKNNPHALKCFERIYQLVVKSKELLDEKHLDLATSLNDAGCTLGALERHEEALKYIGQAHKMRKEILGEKYSDMAESLDNVDSPSEDLVKNKKPLEYVEQTANMRKRPCLEKNPDEATSLDNRGGFLSSALGKHEEAIKCKIQALEMRRELFGKKHLDIAATMNDIGYILTFLGRHEEALEYVLQALEMRKELVDENHPDVAESLINVYYISSLLGRH